MADNEEMIMRRIGRRFAGAACAAGVAVTGLAIGVSGQPKVACDPGNGGLTLPPGFCALVAATDVGTARHLAVAENGDVYVSRRGRGAAGGVVALRDTNGDGKFDVKEAFGTDSATGVTLHNGYLYVAHPTTVERFKMTPGQLKPAGEPEVVVTGLPPEREHEDKTVAFDGRGSMYLNVGAPSNACQQPDRKPAVKGQDPCPLLEKHGGVWKFDENKLGQTQDQGTRFATGLRQFPALAWHDTALYIVMNNRDQLDVFWPETFTVKDNAERPAEPMYRAVQGSNFGWPYCFYDYGAKKLLLNPEYGGDGKSAGRCAQFTNPIASFPAHWAPVDMMFYTGAQFPKSYQGGVFIAFHGSWNRAPMPQDGYNVTFQPFSAGQPSGAFQVFAQGFAGRDRLMNPNDAVARADGVAQAPDGSLYIADSQKGKIWRVLYTGK
jgi:glucose/arabinose dehydrogenase